ncbi:WXG100 family type VII secretion target [Saccharothrix variisporea]|uniref:Outer membrane channel protein CpnT-like N-terminal domain-containing protein n=1 Tax=Saccharothrix variisporea TaxID=543527 RepID=A0A495XEW2_9PSEU|nr:WXG100 family type VII secretion target [Saccharothrix variisporea]RKT70088.1 hypothetical protein DFJ66_3329 [Saccharothrix variisporea]
MTGTNPLIAPVQDSTRWYSGIGIAESAADVKSGIESGSWVDIGLGVAGVGLEALSFVVDPLGSLLSAGVSWLIEHVKPLSDALDWLAGNADVVASHAATWKNVAKAVAEVRDDYARDVANDTAGWVGQAGDAYRAVAKNNAEVLSGASTAAEGFGSAVEMAGVVVAVVREVVRDLIADLVGRLISWALEVAFTLGLGTPVVVAQASAAVARWGAKIGDILKKLVRTISKLVPLLRKLGDVFAKVRKVLDDLKTPARSGDEMPRPGQTGGARPVDDGSVRAYDRIDRWSENAYQSIRGSDDVDDVAGHVADVPRVGGGTGFSRAEIEQIKNHVFEDLHPLEGVDGGTVMARFDPNPDMAEAWLRLRSGRAQPSDIALLEHELAEARYWQQNPNASYKDAHAAANEVSRWETQIPPASNEDYSKPWR